MGSEGRGRVEISFYNAQDLDRLYDLLITAAPM
jgi:hypothetical protein